MPKISNKTYDWLKWVSQIALPAAGALYAALAVFWGFPKGEEVVGSMAAIAVFIGALLGISTRRYNRSDEKFDGAIDVEKVSTVEDGQHQVKKFYSMNLSNEDVANLDQKKEVILKINKTER